MDPSSGAFLAAPDVRVQHLSPVALASVLTKMAAAASAAAAVRAFAKRAAAGAAPSAGGSEGGACGPTVQVSEPMQAEATRCEPNGATALTVLL
eukprot:853416-Prorocentrum_minimum.AAC.1